MNFHLLSAGLVLAISAVPAIAAQESPAQPYIVHFQTGPAWDASLPPDRQPTFGEHSANMNRLRQAGTILFGARYEEFGLIVLRAASLEAAQALLDADPGVQSGLFIYRLAPLNVFYPWQEPPPGS